jgi:nitrous oxidase accessory protein
MYLEFSPHAVLRDNLVTGNSRYGLHFMRSDTCTYERNRFEQNGAGVAVMYSRGVRMTDNRFERNWGNSAYGLLLKDISDGEIRDNRFARNTVGLYLEDSNRNRIQGNTFAENGWAVKVMANATDNRFERNEFQGNTFDVATNSQSTSSLFEGNWWDRYRGYDLDRDGRGDVPFRPVRLFSVIMEQYEPAVILLRSAFVDMLDAAERLLPILTPQGLVDSRPLMQRPR